MVRRPDRSGADGLGVLVVEPKDFIAARLKEQLERLGHRVLGLARDGREAVAAAQSLHPNLVLIETLLPGLDGINAARAIVTDQPVPVILLTSYVGAELVRRARDAGVVAYLTSVDRKGLASAIDLALERFDEFVILQREGTDSSETLEIRRLVDRATKVLAARLGLSASQAFRDFLDRKLKMRRSFRETALAIIGADEVLAAPDFARCLQLILHVIRPGLRPRRSTASHRLRALSHS